MASHLIFVGTYTRTTSRGIYALELDAGSGAPGQPELAAAIPNPTWVTLSPDRRHLYAVHGSAAQATAFAVDPRTATLTPLASHEAPEGPPGATANPPSHLAIDATRRMLIAANYRDGFVASMPIREDGSLGIPRVIMHEGSGPNRTRQERPHPHSVTLSPDNRFAMVCDLGADRIYSYAIDPASAALIPANPPCVAAAPGAGPRHFTFGADGRHAFAINELANTVTAYDYDPVSGGLSPIQTISTLPAGFAEETTTAEVRLHPNGKFLYGSNRGHDSISILALEEGTGRMHAVDIVPSGGRTPRNFALSPDGRWLVCAHQDSDNLTVFQVDADTGRLTRLPHEARVPMGVCVAFHH